MALAGLFRPSAPASDGEFRRIFGLIAPSYRRSLPAPFENGSLRVQQLSPPEPAALRPDAAVACWVEGRVFNLDALRRAHGRAHGARDFGESESFPELLVRAFEKGALEAVLRDANGDFSAAIYDARRPDAPRLLLCSDRLGLKPLYFHAQAGSFFFCSRLRGALGLAGFSPRIDRAAVESFLDLGHLLG